MSATLPPHPTQLHAALAKAEQEQTLLKQQLNTVAKELNQIENELSTRTQNRDEQHALYRHTRSQAENKQRQELPTDLLDEYAEVLQLEEKATRQLVQHTAHIQKTTHAEKKKLEVEESLVVLQQKKIVQAWSIQESALVESLEEIEHDAALLGKQSQSLRARAADMETEKDFIDGLDDEDRTTKDSIADITRAEIEAELFHIMKVMQTYSSQLGVLKKRLELVHEERSAVNALVQAWREEQTIKLAQIDALHHSHQVQVQHLKSIRELMVDQKQKSDVKLQCRPEVQMLNHLDQMRISTEWDAIANQRENNVYNSAAATDATETTHSTPHTMWLGKHWLQTDQKESALDLEFRRYVSTVKTQVDGLLKLERNISQQVCSNSKLLEQFQKQDHHHQVTRTHDEQDTSSNSSNNSSSNSSSSNTSSNSNNSNNDTKDTNDTNDNKARTTDSNVLNTNCPTVTTQEKDATGTTITKQHLQRSLDSKQEAIQTDLYHTQQSKRGVCIGDAQNDAQKDEQKTGSFVVGATGLLLTPFAPKSKRRSKNNATNENKQKVTPVASSGCLPSATTSSSSSSFTGTTTTTLTSATVQKLLFLTRGSSVTTTDGAKRILRISKDFERVEVLLMASAGRSNQTKRETFHLTTSISSIHQNRNKKLFALLFRNKSNVSRRVMFVCASLEELNQWVQSLQALLYHCKGGTGGLAKLRHQMKTLKIPGEGS